MACFCCGKYDKAVDVVCFPPRPEADLIESVSSHIFFDQVDCNNNNNDDDDDDDDNNNRGDFYAGGKPDYPEKNPWSQIEID